MAILQEKVRDKFSDEKDMKNVETDELMMSLYDLMRYRLYLV